MIFVRPPANPVSLRLIGLNKYPGPNLAQQYTPRKSMISPTKLVSVDPASLSKTIGAKQAPKIAEQETGKLNHEPWGKC